MRHGAFNRQAIIFVSSLSEKKLLSRSSSCCSLAQSSLSLCDPKDCIVAQQASLSFSMFQNLLKLMSIESVMPSNHLILCCHLLFLPSVFPSIRIFSSESALCIRWPKYWSFSFSISPSDESSGLISFMIDWFDLRAVQETQESSLAPQFASISSSAFSLLWSNSHICT